MAGVETALEQVRKAGKKDSNLRLFELCPQVEQNIVRYRKKILYSIIEQP